MRTKGNVTLNNLTINDILTDGSGNSLSLTVPPAYESTTLGSLPGTLKVGEIQTYSAYYTITQAAEDTGSVVNMQLLVQLGLAIPEVSQILVTMVMIQMEIQLMTQLLL